MERKGNPLKSWKLLSGNGENSDILLSHTLKSATVFPTGKQKRGQEEQHSLIPTLSFSRNSSAAAAVLKCMDHP